MFKIFTNNWQAKLISVILAISLWVYVAASGTITADFPNKISLELKNVPTSLSAEANSDSVSIKVAADRTVLSRLNSDSFSATVDLAGLTKGTHEVNVQVVSKITGVEIVDFNPKKVLVYIEAIAKKTVPVKIQTEGQASEGLVPGDPEITPSEVEITGPESVVNKILEATAKIQLNGESANIEKTVKLVSLDAQGEEIKGITFNPNEVKVVLPIVKAGTTKSVGVKVKFTGIPKDGFWISQIITTPPDVTILGANGVLRGINYIETKPIDISNMSANTTKSVDLDLPAGVTLADNIGQIKVDVKVSQISSEKEVDAGLVYDNLNSSLKVSAVDPNVIKIIVSGTSDILNTLNSSNILLHLNLASFKTQGNYSIDITRDMISAPDGVSVSSFVPSAVRVNLVTK